MAWNPCVPKDGGKYTEAKTAEPPPPSAVAAETGQILRRLSLRQEWLVRLPHRKVSIPDLPDCVEKIQVAKLFLHEEHAVKANASKKTPWSVCMYVCLLLGQGARVREASTEGLASLLNLNSNIPLRIPNCVSPFWFPSSLLCSLRRTTEVQMGSRFCPWREMHWKCNSETLEEVVA